MLYGRTLFAGLLRITIRRKDTQGGTAMWRCNQKPPYYLSAYSLAVKSGFKGTLEEWLASLQGPQGEPGPPGPAGESGIYIGSQEPADPGVDVWIDPDDDDIGSLVGMQSAYYVTITDAGNGSYSADRSFADLTVAHQSDKVLRCRYGVFDLPLTRAIPSVIFEFSGAVDNVLHYITIGKVSDGSTASVNVGELQLAESADIPNSLPNPNKLTLTGAVSAEYDGSKPVVVDIPEGSDPRVFVKVTDDGDDNFSADMTFAQIKEAYSQNKMICCNWGGYVMPLSAISSVSAEFSGFSYQTHYRVVIGNYNGVEKVDVYPIQYAERGEIPTTLPNPYKLTFDGVVSGEYDGSRPVNITIPQGGGGGNEWVKVVNLTTEEDLTSLIITSDLGGAPLSYNRLSIYALVPAASVAYKIFVSLADDAGIASNFDIPASAQRHITIQGYPTGVFETTSSGAVIIASLNRGIQLSPTMPYRQISLRANTWQVSGAVIPAGTKVVAYGKN